MRQNNRNTLMTPKRLLCTYSILTTIYVGILLPLFLIGFNGDAFLNNLYFGLLSIFSLINIYLAKKEKLLKTTHNDFFLLNILLDFLYLIPLPLIMASPWNYYSYFLALPALRHLYRIQELLEEFPTLPPIIYRLIPIFLFAPLLVHFTACIWIALGNGSAGNEANFLHTYITAFYWSISTLTTVGYGDISAITPIQMLFACFIQILGVGIFGYVLSNVAGIIARADAAREHHMDNLDRVETYMRIHGIPGFLKKRVRTYYQYLWKNKKGYQSTDLLSHLPNKIQSELLLYANKSIIEKVPFLRGASEELLIKMMEHLEPRIFIPSEVIFREGDPGEDIFFIQSGEVEIVGDQLNHIATLTEGTFFGEMALISERQRSGTAIARTYCDVYSLSRQSFEAITQDYPSLRDHIEKTMYERNR